MHHGATVVHWDAVSGGTRSARIFMRLERNCSTLTWRKTTWSALKRSYSGTPDYSLTVDPEDCIPNSLLNRPSVNCTSVMGKIENWPLYSGPSTLNYPLRIALSTKAVVFYFWIFFFNPRHRCIYI